MSKAQHSFSDDFNKTDSSSSYDDRRSTFFDNESRYESVFSNQVRESFFSSCHSDEDTMDELISKKIKDVISLSFKKGEFIHVVLMRL